MQRPKIISILKKNPQKDPEKYNAGKDLFPIFHFPPRPLSLPLPFRCLLSAPLPDTSTHPLDRRHSPYAQSRRLLQAAPGARRKSQAGYDLGELQEPQELGSRRAENLSVVSYKTSSGQNSGSALEKKIYVFHSFSCFFLLVRRSCFRLASPLFYSFGVHVV